MTRRRTRRSQGGGANTSAWLSTYGDMVTLLLCMFVLLFSMATLDAQKFERVVISMRSALGVLPGARVPHPAPTLDVDMLRQQLMREEETAMDTLHERLEVYIQEQGMAGSLRVTRETPGIVIRFADTVLFDLGRDMLRPEARPILQRLAAFLAEEEYHLRVEGHTDNLPIRTERFPSNWELSTARATRVV
ncbi:MAG TPA: flagellar motor protein MotB, partial [Clostridiales bacterium UBA8153]|nr:flagellar motor protein MotB [Clostridiales bacterium UBA8153]